MKIRNVPVLDQAAKFRDDSKLLELSQPFDREHARIFEQVFGTLLGGPLVSISRFVRNCRAFPASKIEEVPRFTGLAAAKLQNFSLDIRAPLLGGDFQLIGREAASAFPEFDGDAYGSSNVPGDQLAESSAARDRMGHVLCQRLLQEAEDIEERRFPGSVGAHDHGHPRELGERRFAERPVILELEGFDLHTAELTPRPR